MFPFFIPTWSTKDEQSSPSRFHFLCIFVALCFICSTHFPLFYPATLHQQAFLHCSAWLTTLHSAGWDPLLCVCSTSLPKTALFLPGPDSEGKETNVCRTCSERKSFLSKLLANYPSGFSHLQLESSEVQVLIIWLSVCTSKWKHPFFRF